MINYFLNPTTSTDNGQHIARYDYDLRGRLTQRNLGKYGTSSNWLQSLDYTYNELDWLTAINPQGSSGLGVTQNMNEPLGIPNPGFNPASADPDNNDLFFLELKYHDPYANLDVPAISRKSGDVSQVWWRARGRNREGYGLTYDYLGRMTKAQHVRLADGSSPTTPGARIINNYSEQLEYADQRGNIARILRYGMNYTSGTQAGSGVIDDLQFITEPGRNRIQRINEQASDLVFKLKGFRPKTEANGSTSTGGIDYSYDANGNQTSDPHKGILTIQYNYLNLPSLITYTDGRKIEQRYDAAGNLIFRWMTGDVATPANNYFQTYVYGTEYRGNSIESVSHQEGRLFRSSGSNSSPVWRYEYSISDHLGNTRLTFADKTPDGVIKVEDGEVLEEAHYYPFGLAMEGPWMNDAAALDTRYKFNGIERVQDFGLNVDMAMYRAYDPAIGRWWQADPIAKAWENPYAAMYNNPMNWSDFNGADASPGGMSSSKQDTVPAKDWANSHIPKFNYYVGASGGTISNYTPTFWDKAKESNNLFVQLGYGVADGFYTYFQEMNPLNTHTMHLGHGLMTQNEKQDLAMVHASMIPIGKPISVTGKATESLVNSMSKAFVSKIRDFNPAFAFAKNRVPAGEIWVDVIKGATRAPGTFVGKRPYLSITKKGKSTPPKMFAGRGKPWTGDKDPKISPRNKWGKILEAIFSQWE